MADFSELDSLASEIDDLAERLLDTSMALLRSAIQEDEHERAVAAEKIVTRARRSLEKAAGLLRSV